MSSQDRIRIHNVELLSDDWYVLKKTTFDYLRTNGTWQRQSRETYDRGNGAAILLYHLMNRTVILTRQFRFPAFVNGHAGFLTEVPAGLLDAADPEERIRAEVQEETGYQVKQVQKVFEAYMSPGSVTEKLHSFVAEYNPSLRTGTGGGVASEGEDIEVLEVTMTEALHMIQTGEIVDGKTIMLLAVCPASPLPARNLLIRTRVGNAPAEDHACVVSAAHQRAHQYAVHVSGRVMAKIGGPAALRVLRAGQCNLECLVLGSPAQIETCCSIQASLPSPWNTENPDHPAARNQWIHGGSASPGKTRTGRVSNGRPEPQIRGEPTVGFRQGQPRRTGITASIRRPYRC